MLALVALTKKKEKAIALSKAALKTAQRNVKLAKSRAARELKQIGINNRKAERERKA
jgi:hypothetical protein